VKYEDDWIPIPAGKGRVMHIHCPESSPTQERSNDLLGRSELCEHEADAEGKQGEKSGATTRALGAVSEQLLMPCPFCGVDAAGIVTSTVFFYARPKGYVVSCDNCDAVGPYKKIRDAAVLAWNLRAGRP